MTIPLPAASTPAAPATFADATALFDRTTSLMGTSRRNGFAWPAGRVIDANALAHLEHLRAPLTRLEGDRLDGAIADLERLLGQWRTSAAELVRLSGQDAHSEAELRAGLDAPGTLDPAADSDDGDDLLYFIVFMKGHLHVLRQARASALDVFHAQS